jgi:TolB protein
MRTGHEWRSLIENGDYQPSHTRFSRGVVLTSSSILLLIAALIFWPILQFKVSPVSADNSTPLPVAQTTSTPTLLSPTTTATPSATLAAALITADNPPPILNPSTEIQDPPSLEVSTPLQSGLIVLALYEAGHSHLFAYQASNSPYTRLTSGPWDDITPALSPDGRWLAFASNRSGPWDLYLLDLHLGEVTRLTDTLHYESSPSWSPDGNLIAYESYDQDSEIIIRSVFDDQTVINLSEHPAADYQPSWSPQGRQLAFVSNRSGDAEIWLADFDKFGDERFSNLSLNPEIEEGNPSWSPEGTSLAWVAKHEGNHSIYIWDALDGSRYIGSGDWPVWSPDSSILLTSLNDPNQTLLTAYKSAEGRLELPPIVLPGQLTGMTWNDQSLPSPLPQNLQQISLENQEMPWFTSRGGNPESQEVREYLANLAGVQAPFPQLHDSADEAFHALRTEVSSAAGWDFLGSLENAFVPLTAPLPPGMGEDWLYTGRAFAFDTLPMNAGWVVVVPEFFGHHVYWRIFIKARFQNGSLGKPMRQVPWNFNSRFEGDPLYYEQGGQNAGIVPAGYWIDFTEMAIGFGWQRLPALPTWQSAFYAARFNEFVITNNQSWSEAMLDLYPAELLTTPTPIYPPTLTPTRTPSWPVVSTPAP